MRSTRVREGKTWRQQTSEVDKILKLQQNSEQHKDKSLDADSMRLKTYCGLRIITTEEYTYGKRRGQRT
uniref:Uncharacterized protein n=1 Tax=Steinernema glaseri TaxID=37863 RepID=A0A1I7YI85_9BILA